MASFIVLLIVSGVAMYEIYGKEDVTVLVKLKKEQDPFVKLPQILPENSMIKNVRELNKSRNEYMMTITTRKKKHDLLQWILDSNLVEDAEIK